MISTQVNYCSYCNVDISSRKMGWLHSTPCNNIIFHHISGFFLGAKVSDIRLGNMHSFLSWAMYSAHYESLSVQQRQIIQSTALRIGEETNVSFADGYNEDVYHIKMTLNPIAYVHRPFLLYLGSAVKNVFGDALLIYKGFKHGSLRGVTYWYKKGSGEKETPLLFFHGITTGWVFYLPLVLNISGTRPVILIDLDTIKINSLCFDMPEEKAFVDATRDICTRHCGEGTPVSVVGHSFGTILAAWFLRAHPELVFHMTLLDPGKS